MKVDKTLAIIFIPPAIALILCLPAPLLPHHNKNYTPEQPEFLTYVDKLSIFTLNGDPDTSPQEIKDVFRHEWTMPMQGFFGDPGRVPAPIRVSMVVDAGQDSYCIINGKKMRPGDKTDSFRITSIESEKVIITYKTGAREIHHVKAY